MRPMLKTLATVDGFLNRLRDRWPLVFIPVVGLITVAGALIFCALPIALVPHLRTRASITDLIFHASVSGLSVGFFLWYLRRDPVQTYHVTPHDL
jgi:hypothetical protein